MRRGKRSAEYTVKIGYTVGELTVEAKTEKRKNKYLVWTCRCTCGNTIDLDTRCLQRRTVHDCGCRTKVSPYAHDLSGMKFGNLLCIRPETSLPKTYGIQWLCKCDCGRECYSYAALLLSGGKTSCGCMRGPRPNKLVGMRFGSLTVRSFLRKESGEHIWECACDCGKVIEAKRSDLLNEVILDCGCGKGGTVNNNAVFGNGADMAEKKLKRERVGKKGVSFNTETGKWTARMRFVGKMHSLGSYETYEEAVAARTRGEDKLTVHYTDALPKDARIVCWEPKSDFAPEWDHGWHYIDSASGYMIVQCTKRLLDNWMQENPGRHYGISEPGNNLRKLFRHAQAALESCKLEADMCWKYHDSIAENEMLGQLTDMYLKRIRSASNRTEDMISQYGEVCSKTDAGRILSVCPRTVYRMLKDGRLEGAGDMVNVRSICRYIENTNGRSAQLVDGIAGE